MRQVQPTEPSAGRKPASRTKEHYLNAGIHSTNNPIRITQEALLRQPRRRERSGDAGERLHARKTAKAPVLMADAWARTPSIARTGMHRPVCEAPRSAAADSPCLGGGSAAKTLVRPCIVCSCTDEKGKGMFA